MGSCDALASLMAEERPITVDEACGLRLLLFGNTKSSFGAAWTEQGFHFRIVPPYGFIQKRAGPCGVLAAVQAYVIYELVFGISRIDANSGIVRLKTSEKREALARALTSILWQAGDDENILVAVKRNNVVLNASEAADILELDGFIEYLQLKFFECRSCALEYFLNYVPEMMTDNSGSCILLLYSLILTRGFEKIKEEMDDPDSHLIGDDGYCSQEVINLLLIGKAVPNVFDGDIELNSGGPETTLCHGIPRQSRIGLLSLYDYENTSPVGNNYKHPLYPIWLLIGNCHFTVLFASSRNILNQTGFRGSFILYQYNGLSKRHAETTFTIRQIANLPSNSSDRYMSVAERCILTRWPSASVEEKEADPNNDFDDTNNDFDI